MFAVDCDQGESPCAPPSRDCGCSCLTDGFPEQAANGVWYFWGGGNGGNKDWYNLCNWYSAKLLPPENMDGIGNDTPLPPNNTDTPTASLVNDASGLARRVRPSSVTTRHLSHAGGLQAVVAVSYAIKPGTTPRAWRVTGVEVENAGSGYVVGQVLSFSAEPAGGENVTPTAVVSSVTPAGGIASLTIAESGEFWSHGPGKAPDLSAEMTSSIVGGKRVWSLSGVTINDPGNIYSGGETLTLQSLRAEPANPHVQIAVDAPAHAHVSEVNEDGGIVSVTVDEAGAFYPVYTSLFLKTATAIPSAGANIHVYSDVRTDLNQDDPCKPAHVTVANATFHAGTFGASPAIGLPPNIILEQLSAPLLGQLQQITARATDAAGNVSNAGVAYLHPTVSPSYDEILLADANPVVSYSKFRPGNDYAPIMGPYSRDVVKEPTFIRMAVAAGEYEVRFYRDPQDFEDYREKLVTVEEGRLGFFSLTDDDLDWLEESKPWVDAGRVVRWGARGGFSRVCPSKWPVGRVGGRFALDYTSPPPPTLLLQTASPVHRGDASNTAKGLFFVEAAAGCEVTTVVSQGNIEFIRDGAGLFALTASELRQLASGTVTISSVQTDQAWNQSAPAVVSFEFDGSEPLVTMAEGVSDPLTYGEFIRPQGVLEIWDSVGIPTTITFTSQGGVSFSMATTPEESPHAVSVQPGAIPGNWGLWDDDEVVVTVSQPGIETQKSFTLSGYNHRGYPSYAIRLDVNPAPPGRPPTITVGTSAFGPAVVTVFFGSEDTNREVVCNGEPITIALTAAEASAVFSGSGTIWATAVNKAGEFAGPTPQRAIQPSSWLAAPTIAVNTSIARPMNRQQVAGSFIATVLGSAEGTIHVNVGGIKRQFEANGSAHSIVLSQEEARRLEYGGGCVWVTATQESTIDGVRVTSRRNAARFLFDGTLPKPPALTLRKKIQTGATAIEATHHTGICLVQGELKAQITVVLEGQSGQVTKILQGTGGKQRLVLTGDDLAVLGDGEVLVSATQIDEAGNEQTDDPSQVTFTIDTHKPPAPIITITGDDSFEIEAEGGSTVEVFASVVRPGAFSTIALRKFVAQKDPPTTGVKLTADEKVRMSILGNSEITAGSILFCGGQNAGIVNGSTEFQGFWDQAGSAFGGNRRSRNYGTVNGGSSFQTDISSKDETIYTADDVLRLSENRGIVNGEASYGWGATNWCVQNGAASFLVTGKNLGVVYGDSSFDGSGWESELAAGERAGNGNTLGSYFCSLDGQDGYDGSGATVIGQANFTAAVNTGRICGNAEFTEQSCHSGEVNGDVQFEDSMSSVYSLATGSATYNGNSVAYGWWFCPGGEGPCFFIGSTEAAFSSSCPDRSLFSSCTAKEPPDGSAAFIEAQKNADQYDDSPQPCVNPHTGECTNRSVRECAEDGHWFSVCLSSFDPGCPPLPEPP